MIVKNGEFVLMGEKPKISQSSTMTHNSSNRSVMQSPHVNPPKPFCCKGIDLD